MANKPGEANFFPDVPEFPSMGVFQPIYGKFDLTTYIQGASDYEIMAFLVGKYNACLEAYGNITKLSTDTITACKQLQDWINSWFDNLDVQEELNKKIDSMVQDGSFGTLLHQTFDAQINQQTTSTVTAWLVANVTPTGSAVVVDRSLSIEGAAADSAAVGANMRGLSDLSNYNYASTANTGLFVDSGIKGESLNNSTVQDFNMEANECIIVRAKVPEPLIPIGINNNNLYTNVSTKIGNNYYYFRCMSKCTVSCSFETTSGCTITKGKFTHNTVLNALDFGFKNDGVTDNSSIMSDFLKIADVTPISFPSGVYVFSQTINFPRNFYVKLNNAVFKTNESFNSDYFITFRKGSTASDYTDGSYFDGGTIIDNYKCKKACIGCYKTRNSVIKNLIIKNTHIGIETRTETNPDGNITLKHCCFSNDIPYINDIAINDNAFDTIVDDVEIINFTTAIYTIAGRFNNVRAWFSRGDTLGSSIFAKIDGWDVSFSNCAVDTYRYGFTVKNENGGACISNIIVIRNTGIYNNKTADIVPPALILHQSPSAFLLFTNVSIRNDYKYSIFTNPGRDPNCKLINVRLGTEIIY